MTVSGNIRVHNGYAKFPTKAQWEAKRRRFPWGEECKKFDLWPKVGEMPAGEPIRRHPYWGDGVREPDGYVCSPIAFSVRKRLRDK